MAVPTVVRLLPAGNEITDPVEGPTGGDQLLEIYGDNFRLPNTDPVVPIPGQPFVKAPRPRSVSVTFDGVEAKSAEVVKSNLIRVVTPATPIPANNANDNGQGSVDVVITNLDDNEDPIPGESITLVDAYTYRRVKLDATTESDFLRLVATLIDMIRVQVLPEVILTVNTDWDADTMTSKVEIAKLPAIVLAGPDTPENRFYSVNERLDELVNGQVEIRRKPHTIDLLFDIIGISDHPMEILNLMAVMTGFVDRNPFIEMYRDPADTSKGKVKYEFDFQTGGGLNLASRPNNSNLHNFNGSVLIRGFDIEGFQGFKGDHLSALSRTLSEGVILDAGPK